MNETMVFYEFIPTGKRSVDRLSDFKKIRFMGGWENFKELDRKLCSSKKQMVEFEKKCLSK